MIFMLLYKVADIVKNRFIAVTYTLRLNNIRIISARVARRNEKNYSHKGSKESKKR